MTPIPVCMAVNNLDVGGLEKVVISLIERLDPEQVEVHLLCLDGPGKLFDQIALPAERCLILHKEPTLNLGLARIDPHLFGPIRRFLRDRRIALVHAHNLAPLLFAGGAARSLGRRRPRVVYSEHNQIYRAGRFARIKFWGYANLADLVIAVSHDLERTLTGALHIRPPVRVLHNGIDGARLARAAADGARVRRELGIGDREFVIGTAVVLSEQKGVRYLLDAAATVLADDPAVRFVIAGDGPLRGELVASAEARGFGDRVLFPGYRNDVPDLISAFDVYALPSLWEGLPLALLEALALETPIVATTVGGNPEIVEDGVNGFLVPPRDPVALADALRRLRADHDLRRIGTANRAKFDREFRVEVMVERHQALYADLVG